MLWSQVKYASKLKAALNFTRNSESEPGPSALTIKDSLLLESLFLFGALVGTAVVIFIVEMSSMFITCTLTRVEDEHETL